MTTSIDFDRLVTGWLEGAGPATMRPETVDSAMQVVRETPRRTGIRAFLAGPSPWPRRRAIAIDAFPPAVRVAFVAALLAGLLIAGALAVGRRPPEPLPPVRPAVTGPRDSSIETYRGRLSLAAAGALPIGVDSPTVLPDGRVLGFLDNGRTVIWDLDAAEVVDGPRLSVDRYGPETVLLADGRVLVIGGELSDGDHGELAWATAEVVDPVAGTTSPAKPLVEPRWNIATAQLPDGRVLLAGGIGIRTDGPLASAEVFDPTTMAFTPTGSMLGPRFGDLALLPDGRVVATGDQYRGAAISTTEIYDPASGTFLAGDPLDPIIPNPDDSRIPLGARSPVVTLTGGEVLVPGLGCQEVHAYRADGLSDGVRETPIERFDPATGTFNRAGSMPHCVQTAIPLPNGQLYVRGWWYEAMGTDQFVDRPWAGLYDPDTGDVRQVEAPTPGGQPYLRSLLLPDGRVAIFGATVQVLE